MKYLAPLALVALMSFTFLGCGDPSASTTTPAPDAASDHDQADHTESDDTQAEEITTAMAELSEEDATLARAQKVCPVSDKLLGTMGAPKKVDVEGQQVWICCDGCKGMLLDSPQQFLAKLK